MEHTMSQVTSEDYALMDEEVFINRLYVEHRKMYAIAYSYLRTETDALEVVQEASCRGDLNYKLGEYYTYTY